MGTGQAPASAAALFPNLEGSGGGGAGDGAAAGAGVGGASGGAQAAVGGHPGSREDADDEDADDDPPSKLLAPLLEEWPDLMRLVLAQLAGPGRYCRPSHFGPAFLASSGIT